MMEPSFEKLLVLLADARGILASVKKQIPSI